MPTRKSSILRSSFRTSWLSATRVWPHPGAGRSSGCVWESWSVSITFLETRAKAAFGQRRSQESQLEKLAGPMAGDLSDVIGMVGLGRARMGYNSWLWWFSVGNLPRRFGSHPGNRPGRCDALRIPVDGRSV